MTKLKLSEDQRNKAVVTTYYAILAFFLFLAVACVGGGAWILYIITEVVTK